MCTAASLPEGGERCWQLKQRLTEIWSGAGLQQSVVDEATDKWRSHHRESVRAEGRHFEHHRLAL